MATNLNQYARKKWRERGYFVELTESLARLPGGIARKSDLFSFCDLLLLPLENPETDAWIFLQVTSRGHISTRQRKILEGMTGKGQWAIPTAQIVRAILNRGDKILVEGWDQPGGAGTRWRDKERWITLDMLEEA